MTLSVQQDRAGPVQFRFDNSYARLPAYFHASAAPTPVSEPWLVKLNRPLADALGLDAEALERDGAVLLTLIVTK